MTISPGYFRCGFVLADSLNFIANVRSIAFL
jgi:hypothetical protein